MVEVGGYPICSDARYSTEPSVWSVRDPYYCGDPCVGSGSEPSVVGDWQPTFLSTQYLAPPYRSGCVHFTLVNELPAVGSLRSHGPHEVTWLWGKHQYEGFLIRRESSPVGLWRRRGCAFAKRSALGVVALCDACRSSWLMRGGGGGGCGAWFAGVAHVAGSVFVCCAFCGPGVTSAALGTIGPAPHRRPPSSAGTCSRRYGGICWSTLLGGLSIASVSGTCVHRGGGLYVMIRNEAASVT